MQIALKPCETMLLPILNKLLYLFIVVKHEVKPIDAPGFELDCTVCCNKMLQREFIRGCSLYAASMYCYCWVQGVLQI